MSFPRIKKPPSGDRADAGQGCTIPEHSRGGGVTQDVSPADWRFDPGPAHCAPRNVSDRRTSQRTKRSQYGCEHLGHPQRLFDFNGDGKADVALYNMNTAIGYLGVSNGTANFTFSSLFWGPGFGIVNALDLNGDGKIDIVIYNTSNAAAYTAVTSGNPANPFTYQYSFWGTGKVLATATAQP
jgi:hypothetical protein